MKELLKKASLTVATACLIAGGLVSGLWAADGTHQSRIMAIASSDACQSADEAPIPARLMNQRQAYTGSSIPGASLEPEGPAGYKPARVSEIILGMMPDCVQTPFGHCFPSRSN